MKKEEEGGKRNKSADDGSSERWVVVKMALGCVFKEKKGQTKKSSVTMMALEGVEKDIRAKRK